MSLDKISCLAFWVLCGLFVLSRPILGLLELVGKTHFRRQLPSNVFRGRVFPDPRDPDWKIVLWCNTCHVYKHEIDMCTHKIGTTWIRHVFVFEKVQVTETLVRIGTVVISADERAVRYYSEIKQAFDYRTNQLEEQKVEEALRLLP